MLLFFFFVKECLDSRYQKENSGIFWGKRMSFYCSRHNALLSFCLTFFLSVLAFWENCTHEAVVSWGELNPKDVHHGNFASNYRDSLLMHPRDKRLKEKRHPCFLQHGSFTDWLLCHLLSPNHFFCSGFIKFSLGLLSIVPVLPLVNNHSSRICLLWGSGIVPSSAPCPSAIRRIST